MTLQNIENVTFLQSADSGLIVSFAQWDADEAVVASRQLAKLIWQHSADGVQAASGVRDLIPGLNNLLIQYDPLQTSSAALKEMVTEILPNLRLDASTDARHWQLPMIYGGDYGPDLADVASAVGLSPDEVIACHGSNQLTVAIMGFLPGLGYLKGVDKKLYLPRKSSPRQHVPALSVGIAMDQSVIYPLASPGGWNLIGRTPVRLFDPTRDEPVLFAAGDLVSFLAIDEAEFLRLDAAAAGGEDIISPSPVTSSSSPSAKSRPSAKGGKS